MRQIEDVTAFGETKSLREWCEDPRCLASAGRIANRIASGLSPEKAISTPETSNATEVVAFDEVKSLLDWSKDPRCAVSYMTLLTRMDEKWPAEKAISTAPERRVDPPHRSSLQVTAFGETKSLSDWSRDERCKVQYITLRQRVQAHWDPEEAITQPPKDTGRAGSAITIEIFDEEKTPSAWAQDPRAEVGEMTIRNRYREGVRGTDLLKRRGRVRNMITAFGETKSISDWMRDSRTNVTQLTVMKRLRKGIPAEAALTERHWPIIEAFGEHKSVRSWAMDSRCRLTHAQLSRALRAGADPEEAMAGRIKVEERPYVAVSGEGLSAESASGVAQVLRQSADRLEEMDDPSSSETLSEVVADLNGVLESLVRHATQWPTVHEPGEPESNRQDEE